MKHEKDLTNTQATILLIVAAIIGLLANNFY